MMWRLVPVIVDGEVQLYDIYIDGRWIGSRRILRYCWEVIDALLPGAVGTQE